MQATVQSGCVTGGVRTLLRLEGLAVLTAAGFIYWRAGTGGGGAGAEPDGADRRRADLAGAYRFRPGARLRAEIRRGLRLYPSRPHRPCSQGELIMFIGHYGVSFAGKVAEKRLPLWL